MSPEGICRARGKHSLDGMTNIIYNMIKEGESEAEICKKLGMEAEGSGRCV